VAGRIPDIEYKKTDGDKMNMVHRGLLFDLDGVIVDTAKYHYIAWKEVAEELGIPFTLEDNERLKGVSRVRSFEIILEIGNRSLTEQEQEFYRTKKNENYLDYILKMSEDEILPGVRNFLKEAKKKGYQIALGSASKNSVIILERLKLTELFDAIIDGTKVTKAKPDPEVFLKGAEALGLAYEECIVFEDAVAGIEAAHAGGMLAVGIGSRELLPEADMNIPGFEGITIEQIEAALMESVMKR
jgi:beta-phosphoglucomutase